MNCLIVDDNKIARATIKQLCSRVEDLQVVGECEDALAAFEQVRSQRVDLLLLDVEMPGMSGVELARNLGKDSPLVVFTTSKKEYAVEAFELNVVDYLVKPVSPVRFLQALERVREMMGSREEQVDIRGDEFIFIRDGNIVRRLALADILYAEAMGDYVKIFLTNKFYAIHATLKAVEERLPGDQFLRVHRSYLVAVGKIDSIQDGALVISGKSVPVADSYRASLNKRMKIL